MSVPIFTIGHSTRTTDELIRILRAHGIVRLADVRTLPRSRHNPQFNADALEISLRAAGIDYAPLPGLGGLRRPRKDSQNTGWRNAAFRGYADYMEAADFEAALGDLLELAARGRTAIMCAEAVWWRCHRSLLADALLARGIEVLHILDEKAPQRHRLTPFGRVKGGRVTYPPEQPSLPGSPGRAEGARAQPERVRRERPGRPSRAAGKRADGLD
jgi:uncharacterized protein (DUF488 family)